MTVSKPLTKIQKELDNDSSWEICLSMRQISLRERVEIAWFTRDISKSYNKHRSQAFSVDQKTF